MRTFVLTGAKACQKGGGDPKGRAQATSKIGASATAAGSFGGAAIWGTCVRGKGGGRKDEGRMCVIGRRNWLAARDGAVAVSLLLQATGGCR